MITHELKRDSSNESIRTHTLSLKNLPCTFGGVYLFRLLNKAGALLPHLCTLTRRESSGGIFLWHYPHAHALAINQRPRFYGARTFSRKIWRSFGLLSTFLILKYVGYFFIYSSLISTTLAIFLASLEGGTEK